MTDARRMRVLRLVVHATTRQPVLLLGEIDGDRCVPVFLRQPQADVIAAGPRSEKHPLIPQDLIGSIVRGLDRRLEGVEITALRDSVYHADLVFDGDTRVAVRPSDALALAVRDDLPIGVAEEILDAVGQPIAALFPPGGDRPPSEQVQEFHDFLENVDPDDFRDPPAAPN